MIDELHTTFGLEDPLNLSALTNRWSESYREATDRALDLCQTTVGRVADAHVKGAHTLNLPAVVALAETQARLSREVTDAYAKSVRRLLEA